MNETTIVAQPESYLASTDQSALDNRINAIKGKITNAFRSKLFLMFELEEIRWSGSWLDDEIWKEWDASYQAKGETRAPRSWFKWVSMRGIDGDDMSLVDGQSYARWLCTAILYKLIEIHNLTPVPQSGTGVLPLPTSVTQVDAMMPKFRRSEQLPSGLSKRQDISTSGGGTASAMPILPAEEQTHLISYWETAWNFNPPERQFKTIETTGEQVPVPPSRETVRKALESIGEKAPRVEREPVIEVGPADPVQPKKRDEIWEGIKARQQADQSYGFDPEQQRRIQEQAKESQAQQEHRQRLFRWNELLVAFKRSVNDMSVFVNEVDCLLGTQYFAEMREMKVGLITVSDDMDRVMEGVEVLRDICGKLASHNPPSGIEIRTVDTEVN